jgi:MFS family permease
LSKVGRLAERTFESLTESRNFRLYFFGQMVSVTGTWFNATATSVLVIELSNSGVALGVNTALLFLPVLLFGVIGGVLADRHDKRRILIVTQALFMILALVTWWLVREDAVRLWMVYLLSATNGLVTAVDNPTRQSFYMEMVGEGRLTNAVSLNSAVFTGTRILGAALAGELIHQFGLSFAFLIDGVTYVATIGGLIAMRPSDLHRGARSERDPHQLREGLAYVWAADQLRRPLVIMAVVFTLAFNFTVLVPLAAYHTFHGDSRTLGLLSAAAGLGMLAGALTLANQTPHPTWRRLTVFAGAMGATTLIEGVMPSLALAYVAMVPVGFAAMSFAITANSTMQLHSRASMRGRVMALYGVIFLGSTPIGAPIIGWVGQHLGPRAGFAASGVAALAAAAYGYYIDKRMPDRTAVPASWRDDKAAVAAPDLGSTNAA